jgi:hypothetical protein
MPEQIFLIKPDGKLLEMNEAGYASEEILQRLLEDYPALLAGNQIDVQTPRRWLLISREIAIPDSDMTGGRWALDHLFVDQDGIPTLVEVKRSTDTRIRREVVGQMLDYAANSISYWTIDTIRSAFERACSEKAENAEEKLRNFLGADTEQESFWKTIEANLKAGRIRMLFVADTIPRELQRIIEFLNEQMQYAEVLGVEVKQFTGPDHQTLVPRVVGRTAAAQQIKEGQPRSERIWDELSFFEELRQRHPEDVETVHKIVEWIKRRATYLWFGHGDRSGSIVPVVKKESKHQVFALWTYGGVEIYFQYYMNKKPFDDETARLELLRRLNLIPGVHLSADVITRRPSISYSILGNSEALQKFFEAMDWFLSKLV